MSDTVTVALISTSGTLALGVTALLLNFRLFNSLEKRIEIIEQDLKLELNAIKMEVER